MRDRDVAAVMEAIYSSDSALQDAPDVEGLSRDEVLVVLNELLGRGWISAQPLHGDDKLLSVRDLRTTTRGRESLRRLRGDLISSAARTSVTSVEERRLRRAQFMELLYSKTGGIRLQSVSIETIALELGWPEREAFAVLEYLENEGLARLETTDGDVAITHPGVREVEESINRPNTPTEHFAPYSHVVIANNATTVQIQSGTVNSVQSLDQHPGLDTELLSRFLSEFRMQLESAQLQPDQQSEIEADLDTIEAQLRSPRPKKAVVIETLRSLRAVAENLVASGAWVGAAELLQHLPR